MLKILRRIVQDITNAQHFGEALQILVERVREAIGTEASTVFLVDKKTGDYVLLATDGLNPDSIGKIRLCRGEGLVGLVGQREEPINIDDAPAHPRFYYSPEIGEDRYKAFLGVPIIHHRRLLGVLVVQQQERRRFDEAEEAFLVTMSAQLGAVLAHAEATGEITKLLNPIPTINTQQNIVFTGIPSSTGISLGTAIVVYPLADLDAVPDRKIKDRAKESQLLHDALEATRTDIRRLSESLTTLPEEEKGLFDAYLRILDSASLEAEVNAHIKTGQWAQGALRIVINDHIQQFEAMEDDYLRERAADLRDLGRRVLMHLQAGQRAIPKYPAQTILVGEEVSPSAVAEVPEGQLAGIAALRGSSNSHVAILARSLGIPAVLGIENLPVAQLEGQEVFVNGQQGEVYVAPQGKLRHSLLDLIVEQRKLASNLNQLRDLPAQTVDGHNMALWVNTGLAIDAGVALTAGAEGIGLYRTEVLFMSRERFPAEEEQYVIYRQLLNAFAPRPVIMRTLDIGGDKALPYFPVEEDNPFLGWRGIRIMLDHPEIFLLQIRAMLRANHGIGNLRIMLPMISGVNETEEAIRLIEQAYHEVLQENLAVIRPLIGVMIEVPSAVYQAQALAQRADFLSVGSNDLTQYILAVDRNNARVANLYDSLHPAVLHALVNIVKAAHAVNKPVSICGEMASDPLAVPLLLAMGFDALSMNPTAVPRIKWVIRHCNFKQAQRWLNAVLQMDNVTAIRHYLKDALKVIDLENIIGCKNKPR